MLEIILVILFARKIGDTAANKGRSRGAWAGIAAASWFMAELSGGCIGGLMGLELGAYALALGMAFAAAGVVFVAVENLSVAPGFDPLLMDGASAQGMECPSCGSSQTEVQGDTLVCFSCDAMSPA